jgi:hypothetical protein
MIGDGVELLYNKDRAQNEEKWIVIEGGMMKMCNSVVMMASFAIIQGFISRASRI